MIRIGDRPIGRDHPPFLIAEMSGNHNQSLDRALQIVDAAAASGAHALKIQTYTADSMTLDLNTGEFFITGLKEGWDGISLYDLYAQACTPYEWHGAIFERARKLGMVPFSTPFGLAAVDLLESLDVACYKIASFENTDLALIRRVSATGKPVIISTGMATAAEVDETVRAAREAGCKDLILLKCTSTYPATPANTNIRTIPHLRELTDCEVGLSDHTMGVGVSVASVALGATAIEKHFTLRRADGGVDSTFSMEPEEFAQLVVETQRAWESLGRVNYGPVADELKSMRYRRSLYIVRDLEKGSVLTAADIRAIRPGLGLPPKFLDVLIGKRISREVKRGTALQWDLLA